MNKKVYLSGPVTSLPYRDVREKFNTVQKRLELAGYDVYNPCSVILAPEATHEQYMREDLPHLLESDIVYFLFGWEHSHGCRYEHQAALSTGKIIKYEDYEAYKLLTADPRMGWLSQAARDLMTNAGDILGRKRDRYTCDRRLAIIIHLHTVQKLDFAVIGKLLHRNRNTCYQLYAGRAKASKDIKTLLRVLEHMNVEQEEQPQPLPLFKLK